MSKLSEKDIDISEKKDIGRRNRAKSLGVKVKSRGHLAGDLVSKTKTMKY